MGDKTAGRNFPRSRQQQRGNDASDIEVTVEKGEVILTGVVESRHIKRRVEDIIEEQVSGIKHLENRIRPKLPGGQIANIHNKDEH